MHLNLSHLSITQYDNTHDTTIIQHTSGRTFTSRISLNSLEKIGQLSKCIIMGKNVVGGIVYIPFSLW